MEYYPSKHEIQMQEFFRKRSLALFRLKKLGLSMPYISRDKTYEQLLNEYIISDISNNETDFLKDGIKELFKCLKVVQSGEVMTHEEAEKEVFEKHGDMLNRHIDETGRDENVDSWINRNIEDIIRRDSSEKRTAEDVLKQEISEFKIRLGRVNISVVMEQDVLDFKKMDKTTELHIYEKEVVENPYPDIFSSLEGFVLFERLHSVFRNNNQNLADYSFIYRKLVKDGLMLASFKPEKFREWISGERYNITTDASLKTLNNCTTQLKQDLYETLKNIQ